MNKPNKGNRGYNKRPKFNPKQDRRANANSEDLRQDTRRSRKNSADLSDYGLKDGSSGKNDIGFWNKMGGIFTPSTQIQVNAQLGTEMVEPNMDGMPNSTFKLESSYTSVPGVMVMRFVPTPGVTTNSTSPINQLLTSSYAWYRTHYRASSKYEPVDIGIYNIAVASAAMMWAEFARIVGLVRLAKDRNLFYPRALVASMGYNYNNLQKNLSDLEELVNTFASQLRRWFLPGDLAIAKRWVQLSSNAYKDADSEMAQLYVWQTEGYYVYEEGTVDIAGGHLNFTRWNPSTAVSQQNQLNYGSGTTIDDIANAINAMMEPLFGSSSMAQISSDTSTAMDRSGQFTYPDLGRDFTIEPKYELEEQAQIENAIFVGQVVVSPITQTVPQPTENQASYMTQKITTTAGVSVGDDGFKPVPLVLDYQKFVNFHNAHEVSRDDIMINTRMMPTGYLGLDAAGAWSAELTSYGTEIATTFSIVNLSDRNRDGEKHAVGKVMMSSWLLDGGPLTASNAKSALYELMICSQLMSIFDWHPLIYVFGTNLDSVNGFDFYGGTTGSVIQFIGILGDLDQYAIVTDRELKSLNTTATMSALFIDKTTYYTP